MSHAPHRRARAGLAASLLGAGLLTACSPAATPTTDDAAADEAGVDDALLTTIVDSARSLDGSGNNLTDPELGQAYRPYPRVAPAAYADGVGEMAAVPDARYVSNRIYADGAQNVFSSTGLSHWAFVWGQFLDHTIGLAQGGEEDAPIAFDATDPLEQFENDLGGISFSRDAVAEGTGEGSPREAVNVLSSFIDAWNVYGGTVERLEWLREGPIDGDLTNNDPHLLLTADGYLPTAADRPDEEAPEMDLMGRLMGDPSSAVVAGDVRANENIGLTAVQTLFAREHNRIVDLLPPDLPNQVRFELARRIVGAEQQWITYNEFLPALGVELPGYEGYDDTVDPSITTEFATVGYRAHSFIHGELEQDVDAGAYTADELEALEASGVEVAAEGDELGLAVPLNVAFGNPGLLEDIGLGAVLRGLSGERQYANDEMIDDQLRSVLFQVPGPGTADPMSCLDGPTLPDCFQGVLDLGAIDMVRALDHGIPGYNDLREAYGLERVSSFTELTGEATDDLPAGLTIDDPAILDFVALEGVDGEPVAPGDEEAVAIDGTRRSTVAARLAAIYGDVDAVDAFTGMLAERHEPGAELGELQLVMWQQQFTALRDGDRYFYGADPVLAEIRDAFGIDFRRTLGEIITDNSEGGAAPADVFHVADEVEEEEAEEDAPADDERDRPPRQEGDRPRPPRGDRPPRRDR